MRARPALPLSALAFAALAACSSSPPDLVRAPPPAASASETAVTKPAKPLPYPDNRPGSDVDVLHGVRVADPYRWLEDEKAPDVVAWVKSQDELARGELAKMPERDQIAERLKKLTYVDVLATPVRRGPRYFQSRRHADKEKAILYVRDTKKAEPRVLLDPNTWSADGTVSLGTWVPSRDGKKLAYTVKKNNSDEATLEVIDVATGKKSDVDRIEGAKYAHPSWTGSGDGFYYTYLPTDPSIPVAERPGYAEIRFHELGTPASSDVVVRGKTGDPTKFVDAFVSKEGDLLISSIHHGWSGSEVYFKDPRKADATWTPLSSDGKHHYRVEAFAGRLYVSTNEGASRFRVFSVDPKKPARADWKEIVPEHPEAALESFSILGGKLALSYLEKASAKLEIRELSGKLLHTVALPGLGTVGGPIGRDDDDEAYLSFQSFTTPLEIHELSMKTGKTTLSSRVEVDIERERFVVEQTTYKSKDGTPITMFIVRGKDAPKNGDNAVLLYGYGGFQVSETPEFVSSIYPWLERGGIYAVPNLRGGGEYGEAWHEAGMLDKKQNVFDDFIGAAEHLVAEGWTKPERLVIQGGSNGGLLVGAVMTQRPELYAGVICGVPLLDMVRYHLFGSGKTWISEYGSADDAKQFQTLHAYSPYHHVKPGVAYPPMLMMAADSDDRVDPMHARKFTAAVQDASAGGAALLRVERNSGHGGADLRKAEVQKSADRLAFALWASRR
jgi:prolyl oligopeptidase